MTSFKNFLRWYSNKDVVPTLKVMKKLLQRCWYVKTWLKFNRPGRNLLTKINWCRILSIHGRRRRTFWKNLRRFCWFSINRFSRKTVVDETSIWKTTNFCKSVVCIDASQLHPYSMGQPMPIGLYTRWDLNSETGRFTPQKETRPAAMKMWSNISFEEKDQNVKLKASIQQAHKRKLTNSVFMGFILIATLCSKQWVAFTTSVPLKNYVHL